MGARKDVALHTGLPYCTDLVAVNNPVFLQDRLEKPRKLTGPTWHLPCDTFTGDGVRPAPNGARLSGEKFLPKFSFLTPNTQTYAGQRSCQVRVKNWKALCG